MRDTSSSGLRFKTSLRYRVALAFALLGALVGLALSTALYALTQSMEERLITETLAAELEDYMVRHEADPQTPPPSSTALRSYVLSHEDPLDVPAALRGLRPGLRHVHLEGKDYYAEVRAKGDLRFIVLYDDAQVRRRGRQILAFLAGGVLATTVLSAALGLWLGGRVVSPVAELARRVAHLRPEDRPEPLAGDFPGDEVGELARDFDAYLKRLQAFIERERAFTADVSHELRTPLAVIEGAAEVLLADPDLDEPRRARVERVARSALEMSELIGALLSLAREEGGGAPPTGTCAVEDVLRHVLEGHRHLLRQKPVEVELEILAPVALPMERALLHVVFANVIRNAFSYTDEGHVRISLDEQGVTVEDTGTGIHTEHLKKVFDRFYTGRANGGEGIGLSLVKRICQRYGWRIAIDSCQGCGTVIRLAFFGEGDKNGSDSAVGGGHPAPGGREANEALTVS